jgi:hypothetical protein
MGEDCHNSNHTDPYGNVEFIRGIISRLYASKPDEYAYQQGRQNGGLPCEHCGSLSGHTGTCGLLNRAAGEAQRAVAIPAEVKATWDAIDVKRCSAALDNPTEGDRIIAHGLGVQL